MGGVNKVNQNQQAGASISIAMSLTSGLGGFPGGGAQAFAGPDGAFAQAGGPGGLGSFANAGCGCPNSNAMAGNFGQSPCGGPGQGGPQNAFQAGFQQGQMAAKMKKLMRKMHKLMAQMGGGMQGMPGMNGPGGAFASAGPGGAFASAGGNVGFAGPRPLF